MKQQMAKETYKYFFFVIMKTLKCVKDTVFVQDLVEKFKEIPAFVFFFGRGIRVGRVVLHTMVFRA